MAEYTPLCFPEAVKVKLDHWLYPDGQSQIPDKILFELIQDVGCSRGGQRWEKSHEVPFFVRNDAKAVIGYTHPSAWIRYQDTTYEVRMGGSAASKIYTLFKVENGAAKEASLSEAEQRRRILFMLSRGV